MEVFQITRTSLNTCTISCARCGKSKELNSDEFRQLLRSARVKCSCGQTSQIAFEQRRRDRLPVDLTGALYTHARREFIGAVTIAELSLQGVRFVCPFTALEVGQQYCLSFVLDDDSEAEIKKAIIVRHVYAQIEAGAEFLDGEHYNCSLDFYLMTQSAFE